MRKSFGGRSKSSWAAPKAVRGKCERGYENANADGAGAKVFAGDGCSQERLSAPWPRFHGVDRADVYIIIHVRACCCGECALNPPTSRPIPRRRPPLAPAQRTPFPSTPAPPRNPDTRPQAARCITRRPHNTFPAEDLRSPTHSDTPFPSTSDHPRNPDARPQAVRSIPRRPHHPFPVEALRSPPHSDTPFPNTSARPRSADAHPQAARCTPTALTTHSPQRHAASPSVPLRAQKNGTAQWMCDAECLGRPSLRSVIGVGEPRAVRRRCGALACRRGA